MKNLLKFLVGIFALVIFFGVIPIILGMAERHLLPNFYEHEEQYIGQLGCDNMNGLYVYMAILLLGAIIAFAYIIGESILEKD